MNGELRNTLLAMLADALSAHQCATGILPVGISNANHGQGCPCHTGNAKVPRASCPILLL